MESARGGLKRVVAETGREGKADHTIVWSHYRLGDVEMHLGNREAAREAYSTGFDMAGRLADADPDGPTAQLDLGSGYDRLAVADLEDGRVPDALAKFQKGLTIRRRLADRDESNPDYLRPLGASYARVGDMHMWLSRTAVAEEYYRKGLDVRRRLARRDESDQTAQSDVASSYLNLGDATIRLGRVKAAQDHYQRCNDACEKVTRAEPQDVKAQALFALSCDRLGGLHLRLQHMPDALAWYQKALDTRRKLAEADPKNVTAQTGPFFSYYNLGTARMVEQNFPEATRWFAMAERCLSDFEKAGWYTKPDQRLGIWPYGRWVEEVGQSVAACEKAEQALADAEFAFQQPADLLPLLIELRVKGLVKAGKLDDAAKSADRFAEWAGKQKGHGVLEYTTACYYAVCAAATPAADRYALVGKSLAHLRTAKAAGRFDPAGVAHFHQDPDFDALRDRPDFVEFVNGLDTPPEK